MNEHKTWHSCYWMIFCSVFFYFSIALNCYDIRPLIYTKDHLNLSIDLCLVGSILQGWIWLEIFSIHKNFPYVSFNLSFWMILSVILCHRKQSDLLSTFAKYLILKIYPISQINPLNLQNIVTPLGWGEIWHCSRGVGEEEEHGGIVC